MAKRTRKANRESSAAAQQPSVDARREPVNSVAAGASHPSSPLAPQDADPLVAEPPQAAVVSELEAAATVQAPVANADLIGRIFDGRYRIEERIGTGGVGTVYRATQLALGRQVALKLLLEGLDASFRARFEREARVLAGLKHPNVVAVTDFGVFDGTPYLVMELLEGTSLAERLRRGPLLPEHALEVARPLLRALAYMHDQGLVHRDLKPGNLFLELTPEGEERLEVLDFGLAKFVHGPQRDGEALTRTGHAVGTPGYMAPEQVVGDVVDPRADLYAVGVLLYQMLTGRLPYEGDPMSQLRAHLAQEIPTLEAALPSLAPRPELAALIRRALTKDRTARFQNASELLEALEALPRPWLLHGAAAAETAFALPTDSSRSPSGARLTQSRPFRIALACAALGAAIVLVTVLSRPSAAPEGPRKADAPARSLAAQAPSASAPTTSVAAKPVTQPVGAGTPPPASTATTRARNPFTEGTPWELRSIRSAVAAGHQGTERNIATLRRYNRRSDSDTRGHLLLAQLYMNRGWREDALHQYELVLQLDPSARGAPGMRANLSELSGSPKTASAATRLIRAAYGAEARRK